MKSMTGYAYNESTRDDITVSVEIKGYNSRFLDLSIHITPWLSSLEPQIKEYISSMFLRGKIEVGIKVRELNAPVSVTINKNAAAAYMNTINSLAMDLGLSEKADLKMILGFEGVLETDKNINAENYWALIRPILEEAASKFDMERIREGNDAANDILSHLAILEDAATAINAFAPEIEETIKKNLRERFTDLLGEKIDESRILAETAVLLMKYTISEELSRLSSHLTEFRSEAVRNQSPGKKLDFLCQEINREINTIGSKTPILDVSRAVVEMKNALENIREQLRNVE